MYVKAPPHIAIRPAFGATCMYEIVTSTCTLFSRLVIIILLLAIISFDLIDASATLIKVSRYIYFDIYIIRLVPTNSFIGVLGEFNSVAMAYGFSVSTLTRERVFF